MATQAMIYVVDDDAASRDAMRILFDSVSLPNRCYADGQQFLQTLDPEQIGCAILDLRMPGMNGLEVQTVLRKQHYDLPVIFLTGHGRINAAVRAMSAGATDFLTKPVDDELLLAKTRAALAQARLNAQVRAQREQIQARVNRLTAREHEVLQTVVHGLSNKAIARELGISYKTVELHRARMMEKMEAHSIAEVVQLYLIAAGTASAQDATLEWQSARRASATGLRGPTS